MLTKKQEDFCKAIVNGLNGKQAYQSVYNSTSDNAAYIEACKLLKRDDIQAYIETLKKPIEIRFQAAKMSESDRIKDNLWSIINDINEKTENKIRAMDILNRMNQAYTDTATDNNRSDTLENIDSNQLLELIKAG